MQSEKRTSVRLGATICGKIEYVMSIAALVLVGLPSRQGALKVPFMRAHLILEGASSPCAARLPRYSFDKVRERARTSMASSAQTALFSRSATAIMLVQALCQLW